MGFMNICEIGLDRYDACKALLNSMNPAYTDDQWKVLFTSRWTNRAPGMAIEVDGTIGGIMMLISSEREIEGKRMTVCAPSTWVVAPEFRQYSLALLQAVMELDYDLIITHTLSEVAYKLFKRFKLLDFEDSKIFVLPGGARGPFKPYEDQYVLDHPFPGCIGLEADGVKVILKRLRKIKNGVPLTTFEVLYTNQPLNNRQLKRLAAYLFWKSFAAGILVDSRFTTGPISGPRFDNRKLFRGDISEPNTLDNLYSELALLHRGYP